MVRPVRRHPYGLINVRLGATLVHLSPAPQYPTAEWARTLAGAGFDSLWTPQIVGRGFFVPDPFVTLAVAAAATSGVALGTATVQVPLHHPADLAYRIRSLADVCGDRLSIGLSPGSTEADHALFGRDFTARFRTFRETVPQVRTMLGPDAPPLLLGSWGARVERAADEFDGWLASAVRRTPDEIIAAHTRYRAAGGRRAVVCAVRLTCPADLSPTGDALHRYAEAGFDEAVVLIEPGGPDPEQVRALHPC